MKGDYRLDQNSGVVEPTDGAPHMRALLPQAPEVVDLVEAYAVPAGRESGRSCGAT